MPETLAVTTAPCTSTSLFKYFNALALNSAEDVCPFCSTDTDTIGFAIFMDKACTSYVTVEFNDSCPLMPCVFSEKFDVDLNFNCLQRILTNQFFDFTSCTSSVDRNKRYKFDKSGEDYVLYSLEQRAIGRKLKRLYKRKRKNKEFTLVMQKVHVNPVNFRPNAVSIEDLEEELEVSVRYARFKDFEGKLFPERLVFKLLSDTDDLELTLDFTRLEFDVKVSPSFRISNKYKRIY